MRDDWVEFELKEIGEIITGNTPSKKEFKFYDTRDFSFYKPTDLEAGHLVQSSNDSLS